MSRMFEFTTPEGPDYVSTDHISRIRPAMPLSGYPNEPASLVYVADGPAFLARGKAADLARAVEAAHAEVTLAERMAHHLGAGAHEPRTDPVELLTYTRARTELAIAQRHLAEHELARRHPEGATHAAISAETTREAFDRSAASQAAEAVAGERL